MIPLDFFAPNRVLSEEEVEIVKNRYAKLIEKFKKLKRETMTWQDKIVFEKDFLIQVDIDNYTSYIKKGEQELEAYENEINKLLNLIHAQPDFQIGWL